jgi:hypothetical protein
MVTLQVQRNLPFFIRGYSVTQLFFFKINYKKNLKFILILVPGKINFFVVKFCIFLDPDSVWTLTTLKGPQKGKIIIFNLNMFFSS